MQFEDHDAESKAVRHPGLPTPDSVFIWFRLTSDKHAERTEQGGAAAENDCVSSLIYRVEDRLEKRFCHVELVFYWSASTRSSFYRQHNPEYYLAWCAYRKDGVGFWERSRSSYRENGWEQYKIALDERERSELLRFAMEKNSLPFNFAVLCNFFMCTRLAYLTLVYVCCGCFGLARTCGLYKPGEAYFCTELIVDALKQVIRDRKSVIHSLVTHATMPDALHDALANDRYFQKVPMFFASVFTDEQQHHHHHNHTESTTPGAMSMWRTDVGFSAV
jgi:hypothetical protein